MCTLAGNGVAASVDGQDAIKASVNGPVGVAVYPPQGIVVVAYEEQRLRVLHHNGSISTLAGGGSGYLDSESPLLAQFDSPSGACTDIEGSVALCDQMNNRIRIVLRNGSVRTLAGSGGTGTVNGGYSDSANPLQARFHQPHAIASIVENGQHLFIIGGNNDQRVRVIYPNKTVSTLAGSGGIGYLNCASQDSGDPLAARFCHPIGVAQDRFGNIIVAETFGGRVRKVWRDGSHSGVTTVAGSGPIGVSGGSSVDSDDPSKACLFTPIGVALDNAGNIIVSTVYEHRFRIIFVNGSVRTLAGSGPSAGLTSTSPGGLADNIALNRARFNRPHYFVVDRHNNVILADKVNNRVRFLYVNLPDATSSVSSSSTFTLAPSTTLSSVPSSISTVPSLSVKASTKGANRTASTSVSPSIHSQRTVSRLRTLSAASSQSSTLRLASSALRNPISRLVASEEVARAVVASGAAAAALAGIAATTSMGHATRMGALMRSVECAFAEGELDPPSYVELPIQWSINSQSGPVGTHAGSALLTSAVLVVLPLFMCAVVHAILSSCGVSERRVLRSLQCNVLSRYCMLCTAYLIPNVVMSTVVVVWRGASSDAVVAAVCAAIIPLLLGCVAGQRALAMDADVVPLCGDKWELRNRPSSRAYVETFGCLVEGCRDPLQFVVRACFLEDVVASLVLSVLSGVSMSMASCEWVAAAMLVVSALHLLYVAYMHPLRSKVESAMNCSLCSVQVLMAALCLAVASGARGVLISVLGVVAVIQNVSFFAQAGILAACAWVHDSRKKHALASGGPTGGDAMMVETNHHALLAAPDPTYTSVMLGDS